MKHKIVAFVGFVLMCTGIAVFQLGSDLAEEGKAINRLFERFDTDCGPRVDHAVFSSFFGRPNTVTDVAEAREIVKQCSSVTLAWASEQGLDAALSDESLMYVRGSFANFESAVATQVSANQALPVKLSEASVEFPSVQNESWLKAALLIISGLLIFVHGTNARTRESNASPIASPKPTAEAEPEPSPVICTELFVNGSSDGDEESAVDEDEYYGDDEDDEYDEFRTIRRESELARKDLAAMAAAARDRDEREAREARSQRERARIEQRDIERRRAQDTSAKERAERQQRAEKREQEDRQRAESRERRREQREYESREKQLEIVYRNKHGTGVHTNAGGSSVMGARAMADNRMKSGSVSGYVIRNKNGKVVG